MLFVNVDTGGNVGVLNFFDDVVLNASYALGSQNILRIDATLSEYVARSYLLTVFYFESLTEYEFVFYLVALSGSNSQNLLSVVDSNRTCDICYESLTLRTSCFKQFLYSGQTVGDIARESYTAGVEGSHRKLSTGFTD